jgi:hypothetical protein
MDTFTTRHHPAHGFCTVCGTAWPCWSGLRQGSGVDAIRRSSPPLLASVGGDPW